MFGFRKRYLVEVIHDSGVITKVFLHGTKKEIEKDIEYYKSKAYWWEYLDKGVMIMRTNQPV